MRKVTQEEKVKGTQVEMVKGGDSRQEGRTGGEELQVCREGGVSGPGVLGETAGFIHLEPDKTARKGEDSDFGHGKIESLKIPRHIRFVEQWPMSATKIQKFKLQEMLAQELEQAGSPA